MKTILSVLIFMYCGSTAYSQQRPYYTQYILNNYIINPAIAGIENYWDAKLSHRHQWAGLQGAPVTTYFTIQGPLKKSDFTRQTATGFHTPGENPRGKFFGEEYQSADAHHGMGFTILNDKTGPVNRFSASASYAYHIPLTQRLSLSAGISAGIQNMRLYVNELYFGGQYPADPAAAAGGPLTNLKPDINIGVWLYSCNYFLGLAAQQVVPNKIGFGIEKISASDGTVISGKLVPHIFLQGGYKFLLNEDISFLPSATVKYISPVPLSFDLNAKLQYRDMLWAGASIRPQQGYAAMVGLSLSSSLNIGYSYDFTSTRLNTVSRGTHEIIIGFLLGNNYGDWCPRNVW